MCWLMFGIDSKSDRPGLPKYNIVAPKLDKFKEQHKGTPTFKVDNEEM
jgi:hypothetical protein